MIYGMRRMIYCSFVARGIVSHHGKAVYLIKPQIIHGRAVMIYNPLGGLMIYTHFRA